MSIPQLRNYQKNCIKEIYDTFNSGENRCLLVAATGSGKTTMAAKMAFDCVNSDRKNQVQFLVHRTSLIPQTIKAMERWGLKCGVVAGEYAEDRSAPVQVCSFQSLGTRSHDLGWLKPKLTLADECHITSFVGSIENQFPKLNSEVIKAERGRGQFYVGLTATPWRASPKQSLGDYFDRMVAAPSIRELIDSGNLVRPVYYDLAEPRKGDIAIGLDYVFRQWNKYAQRDLTLVFCKSVNWAIACSTHFNSNGIPAAAIHHKLSSKERDRIFEKFKRREILVLTSCLALNEGVDLPAARVGMFCRKTNSKAMIVQAFGRLLRPDSENGKTDCIALDFMGLFSDRKFGRIEDIVYNRDCLDVNDDDETGFSPQKQCPTCRTCVHISARFCTKCGSVFEFATRTRFVPEGDMTRVFANNGESEHFRYYQAMVRQAYRASKPFDWADETFISKYGYFPPKDWRRGATINNEDPAEQSKFKEYLEAIARSQNKPKSWVYKQLSLELGI